MITTAQNTVASQVSATSYFVTPEGNVVARNEYLNIIL